MTAFVRVLTVAVLAAASWLFVDPTTATLSGPASASAQEKLTIDQLLQRVRQGRITDNAENQRRINEFAANRNRQAGLLASTKASIKSEEARSEVLEADFAELERILNELSTQLTARLGASGEIRGVIRQVSADTKAQIENSIISTQLPGRTELLAKLSASSKLPTTDELIGLWTALFEEMTEQGKIVTYRTAVTNNDGVDEEEDVTRLGPFVAISSGDFLDYSGKTGKLSLLAKQPPSRFTSGAGRVERASPDGNFVQAAIDPSQGGILDLLVGTPSLLDRVNQGGNVGYAIIALAGFGVVLGIYRLFVLWGVSGAVRRQIRAKRAGKGNPLGRVMLAYEENQNTDVETLELKLDDAILRELPKLDFGLNTLKLIAAVGPLMGLLGTVVGMIITFQQITLFGTGDPKVMAGGISQALVTTVLGLVTAIPILFLHSFAHGSARSVQQVLEEQAAGIIAKHAEGGR